MSAGPYRRVLLKISGEVLAGPAGFGIDPEKIQAVAAEIAEVAKTGVQIGLVVGGVARIVGVRHLEALIQASRAGGNINSARVAVI